MSRHPFPCKIPPASKINSHLPGAYYYDCYALEVPDTEHFALTHILRSLENTPLWVTALMALRNKIVQLVGLRNLGRLDDLDVTKPASAYVSGDEVGIFTLISNTPTEAVMGISDRHLDVVLSTFKGPGCGEGIASISVTTVVHIRNFWGRVYMLPVTPLHKLIAPAILSRAARGVT